VRSFLRKQLSQYEGEKRLDQANERLAVGKLAGTSNPVTGQPVRFGGTSKPDHVGEWLCDICHVWKRSFELVPTRTLGSVGLYAGSRVKNLKGRYIRACVECAGMIKRAS